MTEVMLLPPFALARFRDHPSASQAAAMAQAAGKQPQQQQQRKKHRQQQLWEVRKTIQTSSGKVAPDTTFVVALSGFVPPSHPTLQQELPLPGVDEVVRGPMSGGDGNTVGGGTSSKKKKKKGKGKGRGKGTAATAGGASAAAVGREQTEYERAMGVSRAALRRARRVRYGSRRGGG